MARNPEAAAAEYLRAAVALKKDDLPKAEEHAKRAVALDRENADHLALEAWILAQKPEAQSLAKTMQYIETMNRALLLNAECERAYFYRGLLYKRIGNVKLSIADCRKAYQLNPSNAEAGAEVRAYQAKHAPTATAAEAAKEEKASVGGFFAKLLKR